MPARLLLALLLLAVVRWSLAAPVQQPHSEAELIAEHVAVTPGQPVTVGLRLRMDDHWHVYWKNPGDAGMATGLAWTLPPGFQAAPMQWPAPRRIDVGPLTSYGYEGEVLHLVEIAVPFGSITHMCGVVRAPYSCPTLPSASSMSAAGTIFQRLTMSCDCAGLR